MTLKPSKTAKSPSPSSSPNPKNPNPKSPKSHPKPSLSPSKPSMSNDESSRKRKPKDLDDEDNITILNAVVEFRSNHGGAAPTPTTMKPVFDALKGSLHRELTIEQLYNKFRTLKHRYYKSVPTGAGPTPSDRAFYDLSVKAWGEKKPKIENGAREEKSKKSKIEENGKEDEKGKKLKIEENGDQQEAETDEDEDEDEDEVDEDEDEDAGDSFKYLIDQVTNYRGKEGLSMATLELGLKLMDKSKAKALEKKWRKYFEADLKIQAKSYDVNGEVLTALVGDKNGV